MKQNKMSRTVFSVTGLIVVAKLFGFFKQMVVADHFGTTIETDIFNLALGFIGNLQYLLVQSMLTALVAVYIYTQGEGEDASKRFSGDAFRALSVIAVAVSSLVFLISPWISRLLAPTYNAENTAALRHYLRLFSPILLLLVWTAVFNALLHANKRFIPGEMISLNQSILVILFVVFFSARVGIRSLILSFFAYAIWNTGYTAILARRYLALMRGNPFRNEYVQRLLRMMGPLLLGYSLVYVNQLVDKILVSGLAAGTVTSLGYGAVLSNLVTTFIAAFASLFFPYITDKIVQNRQNDAAALTEWTVSLLLVVFLPISILTSLYAEDIVTIVYARGAFDAQSVAVSAKALRGYSFSFIPFILSEVYSRFIYGYRDSKHPMINSSISIVCNIILSIVLCPRYGVFGVTLASSFSAAVCGVLNVRSAHSLNQNLCYAPLLRLLSWLTASGLVCAFSTIYLKSKLLSLSPIFRFLVLSAVGLFLYTLVLLPLLLHLCRTRPNEKK